MTNPSLALLALMGQTVWSQRRKHPSPSMRCACRCARLLMQRCAATVPNAVFAWVSFSGSDTIDSL